LIALREVKSTGVELGDCDGQVSFALLSSNGASGKLLLELRIFNLQEGNLLSQNSHSLGQINNMVLFSPKLELKSILVPAAPPFIMIPAVITPAIEPIIIVFIISFAIVRT
jgi:hypothetical protein